jgi:hypothetical protein
MTTGALRRLRGVFPRVGRLQFWRATLSTVQTSKSGCPAADAADNDCEALNIYEYSRGRAARSGFLIGPRNKTVPNYKLALLMKIITQNRN